MDGASMATPHIAGLAGLLMQAEPSATVDQIEATIFQSQGRAPAASGGTYRNRLRYTVGRHVGRAT